MTERWRYWERRAEVDRALQQALRTRETGPLCALLRSNEPLEYDQSCVLADILQRHVEKKPRGRPRDIPTARENMEHLIAHVVCRERDRLGRKLRWGELNQLIERIGERFADDGTLDGLDIDEARVRERVLRRRGQANRAGARPRSGR